MSVRSALKHALTRCSRRTGIAVLGASEGATSRTRLLRCAGPQARIALPCVAAFVMHANGYHLPARLA
jgi:hypothetical protein